MTTYRRLSRSETVKAINAGATLHNDYDDRIIIETAPSTGKRYLRGKGFVIGFETAVENDTSITLKDSIAAGGIRLETVAAVIDSTYWYTEADE